MHETNYVQVSGGFLSAGTVFYSYISVVQQRTRQSATIRDQALILDSLHDRDVVLPEEAPVEWQRSVLRQQSHNARDGRERFERWWNHRVQSLNDWLNGVYSDRPTA